MISSFDTQVFYLLLEPLAKRHEEAGIQGASDRKSEAYTEVH
jgi:hypothetical protein